MKPDTLTRAGWPSLAFSRFVLRAVYSAFFITLFFSPLSVTAQEADCGDIVAPRYFLEHASTDQTIDREQISDCSDPFGETTNPPSPYSLKIDGNEVISGEVVTVAVGGTRDFRVDGFAYGTEKELFLFKHEGGDYVYLDINSPEITDQQIIDYGAVYFAGSPDLALYQEVIAVYFGSGNIDEYFYDENGDEILDSTGTAILSQLYIFLDSAETTLLVPPPLVQAGTYTMVIEQNFLLLTERTWQQQMRDFFIKTAYAQEFIPPNIYTITFTIVEGEQPYASSVLFLPGIQASRLYKDGLIGTEDQLWTPDGNQDMRQLEMNVDGTSINDIYTKDILDSVFGLGTIYAGFSESLDDLVQENKIKDWEPYAYDWRYAVDIIARDGTRYQSEIKKATDLVVSLADDSFSEKVTIVAHSNGGLLAKAVIEELKNQGKDNLVDRLVLLASPQLGAPKAIGTILHGFDQGAGGGLVIDASVARYVVENMPGAYSLLPGQDYLVNSFGPVVKFQEGVATQAFRAVYGDSISSLEELDSFLKATLDARTNPQSVYEAGVVNEEILNASRILQNKIDLSWIAPEQIEVVEVVGTGIPTVTGFEYRNYKERKCTQELFTQVCVVEDIYKPVPLFSLWGDETVTVNSAEGYTGDKNTFYFDLNTYREIGKFDHANFTEAVPIQNLVELLLLKEEVGNTRFITDDKNNQTIQSYKMFSSHSPVDLIVSDSEGREIKIERSGDFNELIEDIPGGYSFYHGSTTYVVVPSGEDYEVKAVGSGHGSVTLEVDSVEQSGQVLESSVLIGEIYPGSVAYFGYNSDDTSSGIKFDENGDEIIDYVYNLETGERTKIENATTTITTTSVKKKGSSTKVKEKKNLTKAPVAAVLSSSMVYNIDKEEYQMKLYKILSQLLIILKKYEQTIRY